MGREYYTVGRKVMDLAIWQSGGGLFLKGNHNLIRWRNDSFGMGPLQVVLYRNESMDLELRADGIDVDWYFIFPMHFDQLAALPGITIVLCSIV